MTHLRAALTERHDVQLVVVGGSGMRDHELAGLDRGDLAADLLDADVLVAHRRRPVDGAGYFITLRLIILPLSRPAIATVCVVAFVKIWNEFFFANLLTVTQSNHNVQLALAGFKSQFGFNVTGAMAGATIIMLVPVALLLLLQRQVIAVLTTGAVK